MPAEASTSFFERMQKWLQNPLTLLIIGGVLIVLFLIAVSMTILSWKPSTLSPHSVQQDEATASYTADADSLQPVSVPEGYAYACDSYFKDHSRVLRDEWELSGVDPATFRVVGYLPRIPVLYNYACVTADQNAVYVDEEPVPSLDPVSVETLGIYLKDNEGVYIGTEKIDADPSTFEIELPDGIVGKDKDTVYLCGIPFMPHREGTESLGGYYGRIGSSVYYKGALIPGADADLFEVLGGTEVLACESEEGGYARDGAHVYFNGVVIEGADPASFERDGSELGVAHDATYEYRDGVKIPNDFVHCSDDPSELPEQIQTDTSAGLFEFCITPAGETLVSYQLDNQWSRSKKIELFNNEGVLLRAMDLDCNEEHYEYAATRALQSLDGSTLSLACVLAEACTSRVFYELDFNRWRDAGINTLQRIDGWRDCGYRG